MYEFYDDWSPGVWDKEEYRDHVREMLKKVLDLWVKCDKGGEALYKRAHFRLHGYHDYTGAIEDAEQIVNIDRWKEPAQMIIRKSRMASQHRPILLPEQQKKFQEYRHKKSRRHGDKWSEDILSYELKAFEYGSIMDHDNAKCCLQIAEEYDSLNNKTEAMKWCNIGLKFNPSMADLYTLRARIREGITEEDLKDYEMALLINPNDRHIKKGIANIKKRLASNASNEAQRI